MLKFYLGNVNICFMLVILILTFFLYYIQIHLINNLLITCVATLCWTLFNHMYEYLAFGFINILGNSMHLLWEGLEKFLASKVNFEDQDL